MHDELGAVARRRGALWVVVAAAVAAAGPAATAALVAGWRAATVTFAVAGAAILGVLVADPSRGALAAAPRPPVRPAAGEVAGVADRLAVATGGRLPVWEVEHPAPNVGVLPTPDGDQMAVTTGALARLNGDQLEAVCAAQLAVASDRSVRRLLHAAATLSPLRWPAFAGLMLGVYVLFVDVSAALAVNAPFVSVAAASLLCSGRLTWWGAVAADAVCVRTTRHPDALAAALESLAAWEGDQLPVGGGLSKLWTPVDAYWALPVGVQWEANVASDGRVTGRITSDRINDERVRRRAAVVRRLGAGVPATLAAYRSAAAAVTSPGPTGRLHPWPPAPPRGRGTGRRAP